MAIGRTEKQQIQAIIGAVGEGRSVDPSNLSPEASSVARALTDKETPGVISCSEAKAILGSAGGADLKKIIYDIAANPPFVALARRMADKADKWCFGIRKCKTGRVESSDNFVKFLKENLGSLVFLGEKSTKDMLAIADEMAGNDDPLVQENGRRARAFILRTALYEGYNPQFCGRLPYAGERGEVEIPHGLVSVVDKSKKEITTPTSDFIISTETGADPRTINPLKYLEGAEPPCLKGTGKRGKKCILDEKKIVREIIALLNERSGCQKKVKGKKKTELSEVCYTHLRGQQGEMARTIKDYLELQPYLHSIFVSEGVDPHYSVLAIPESHMGRDMGAPSRAYGYYQILPGNTGRAFDVYADLDRGYDERANVFVAARAAAKMLKKYKKDILSPNYMEDYLSPDERQGFTISEEMAAVMVTSAYHAGPETLKRGLRDARRELMAERKSKGQTEAVSGDEAFVWLVTSSKFAGKFKIASKNYPAKFLAVQKLVYETNVDAVFESKLTRGTQVEELSMMSIPLPLSKAVGSRFTLAEIAKITGLDAKYLASLNTHIRVKSRKKEKIEEYEQRRIHRLIAPSPEKIPAIRLVVPTHVMFRLVKEFGLSMDQIKAVKLPELETIKGGIGQESEGLLLPPSKADSNNTVPS